MDKYEVALKLALAAIDKGFLMLDGRGNDSYGKCIAALYNSILENLSAKLDD